MRGNKLYPIGFYLPATCGARRILGSVKYIILAMFHTSAMIQQCWKCIIYLLYNYLFRYNYLQWNKLSQSLQSEFGGYLGISESGVPVLPILEMSKGHNWVQQMGNDNSELHKENLSCMGASCQIHKKIMKTRKMTKSLQTSHSTPVPQWMIWLTL